MLTMLLCYHFRNLTYTLLIQFPHLSLGPDSAPWSAPGAGKEVKFGGMQAASAVPTASMAASALNASLNSAQKVRSRG